MPSPDSISNTLSHVSVPGPAADSITQSKGKEPVRSGLTNRVSTAPSTPPRAGFLRNIGRAVVNALSRLFAGPQTNVARLSNSEKRQLEFQQSLHGLRDALLAPNATKDSIKDALLATEASARMLQKQDGSTGKLIQRTFQELFSKASPEEQGRIATALRSDQVAEAQAELCHNDRAIQVLMGAEVALHGEITRSVQSNVQQQIDAAVNVMKLGGPAARITDHLRLAFAAAVPQVKPGTLPPGYPTDTEVHTAILSSLMKVPDPQLRSTLLSHLNDQDLCSLHEAAQGLGEAPIKRELENELQERPQRLATSVRLRARELEQRHGAAGAFERKTFLREVSAIARGLTAVDQHVSRYNALVSTPPELAQVRQSVLAVLKETITSGKLDLNDLMAIEIRELTSAFGALGASEVGNTLLTEAQGKMLRQCCHELEGSLDKLGKELMSGKDPAQLLKTLTEAAEKATQLNETRHTLGPVAKQLLEGSTVRDVVAQWYSGLPEDGQLKLVAALSGPHFKPLTADLFQAHSAAQDAKETKLATQFLQMAQLLNDIEEGIREELTEPPAETHAAAPASEPTRQALGQLYGVTLSGQQATLKAGHFNPEQTEAVAQRLGQPLTVSDLKCVRVGTQIVAGNFREDARRRTPNIHLANADGTRTPLVDHTNWPAEDDTDYSKRDARIAEGFVRLTEFCGIDAAQSLVVHLNQQIAAGLGTACSRDGSPLHLEDGTAGSILENTAGGGKVDIDVTISKGDNGQLALDVTYRAEGRNTLAPVDGGEPIMLSPDSTVQMDFRAQLNSDGTLSLLNTPSYRFSLKRDDFPKHYAPPTVASLREAADGSSVLDDTLIYAQSVGKEYQITTLRAANAFERQPTLQNAIAVMTECDRGGEQAEGLISPEVRQKVRAAAENSKQGILASLAMAESTAMQIVQHPGDFAGIPATTAYRARAFLEALNELKGKSGAELLEGAERLYHEFIEQPEAGSGRPAGDTLPLDPEVREDIGRQLAAQRQSLTQHAFSPDLFGPLTATLDERIEAEVLPGLIDAVKRGDI
ncbi:hypothetical protein [Peristeroidobacter soli]|uniref:hypothetical protein n=1 Tax=Peristeroidobacter soli TaxID=2497877 RepID=UPI00101D9483|nr:hypothetical protein [Peristeroidobacter soli]